jgi:endonuclease/exonuclease/phosphatase family metal-dependent hydrolase
VIEQANPDIVGLQEVERGWYIDSSLDLAMWLSRRLQMPFVYGPTADPVWGNAILSRYPIKEWRNVALPPRDLSLKRGFMWARIDVGGGEELLFIATHFHDPENGSAIRQQQSPEIVKFWNQQPRTIIVGDLNARPDAPEIAMLRDAGLRDAFAAIGTGNGFSWPSTNPNQRIDYIWHSPDLSVRDWVMPRSTASDHLGIVVTVEKK